jgi:hypothetical protein
MKRIIVQILVFFVFNVILNAQNCPNSDFSQGNFLNWTGTTGTVFTMGSPYDIPGFVAGQHDIILFLHQTQTRVELFQQFRRAL